MAIEPDPNRTITVVLPQHRDLPTDWQPTFYARTPRMRSSSRLTELLDQLQHVEPSHDLAAGERVMQELAGVVRGLLIDWANQADETGALVAFDPNRLEDVIDYGDLPDLAGAIYEAGMLSSDEKKASASPSPSASEAAASGDSTSRAPNARATAADTAEPVTSASNPTSSDAS